MSYETKPKHFAHGVGKRLTFVTECCDRLRETTSESEMWQDTMGKVNWSRVEGRASAIEHTPDSSGTSDLYSS